GKQIACAGKYGQGLEPEKIELYEAGELDPLHVELGDRNIRARVAVEGDELGERAVADDDAGGMRRGMPVETFELERDRHQPCHALVGVALMLQCRFAGYCLLEGDGVRRVVRHQLAQPIDQPVGHPQYPADIAQHRTRLQLAEGDDLGDPVAPVFLLNVTDYLVAPVLAEIDVEIRHRYPFRVEKPLKQEAKS